MTLRGNVLRNTTPACIALSHFKYLTTALRRILFSSVVMVLTFLQGVLGPNPVRFLYFCYETVHLFLSVTDLYPRLRTYTLGYRLIPRLRTYTLGYRLIPSVIDLYLGYELIPSVTDLYPRLRTHTLGYRLIPSVTDLYPRLRT